jgi:hypothetical protein
LISGVHHLSMNHYAGWATWVASEVVRFLREIVRAPKAFGTATQKRFMASMRVHIWKSKLSMNHILVRTILPHPSPLPSFARKLPSSPRLRRTRRRAGPLGEGEWSSDGLIRRKIAAVQGFNARNFRGNLAMNRYRFWLMDRKLR